MKELESTVCQIVLQIARRRQVNLERVLPAHNIIKDLGLESLELAELVAILDMETGREPFAKDVSIVSIQTVGDLCHAYSDK